MLVSSSTAQQGQKSRLASARWPSIAAGAILVGMPTGPVTQLPRTLAPMLATTSPLPSTEDRWAWEPKWDGWRVLL